MVRELPARQTAEATNRTLASVRMRRFVLGIKDQTRATPKLFELIGGPYLPPRVCVGDRTTCLYRVSDVVVTSISNSRIPWPRCRRHDGTGGSGLLVDETLVQAIRTESAAAMMHWFGISVSTIWLWRKAFGVTQWGTPGSKRLLDANTTKANETVRGKKLSKKVVRERRRRAKELDLAQYLRAYQEQKRAERPWTDVDIALIGTMKDTQLARQLGRTRDEVHRERVRRSIPAYRKPPHPESILSPAEREKLRRERIAAAKHGKPRPAHVIEAMRKGRTGNPQSPETRAKMRVARKPGFAPNGCTFTAAEDELIRTLPAAEVVRLTGRSLKSVYSRRIRLSLPDGRAGNGRKPTGQVQ